MNDAHALTPAITLLLVGVLAILLTRRIGQSPIVGYLAACVLIGPHALGLIEENKTTHLLAELGVVFLLFDIGLHFSLSTIWEARRDIFGMGPSQILACGLAFGVIALAFGLAPEYAIILGGALALSSTAVVAHTLAERRQQNCPVGLTGTAILIFQDICAIFLLVFAASLDSGEATSEHPDFTMTIAMAIVKAAVAFIAAVLIGRYAIKPMFRLFSQTKNEEVFTAIALLIILATATATGRAGLSLTLGAFLGGMIISETPFRHIIQTEAKPFRNLLLAFFSLPLACRSIGGFLLCTGWKFWPFLLCLSASKRYWLQQWDAPLAGLPRGQYNWRSCLPRAVSSSLLLWPCLWCVNAWRKHGRHTVYGSCRKPCLYPRHRLTRQQTG